MPRNRTEMPLPPGWAEDSLSEFVHDAFANALATFVRKKPAFNLLRKIEATFGRIGENLDGAENALAVFLLHRSHSAFIASCRLAMSGQAAETFPVLRSCLEYGLYALHTTENSDLAVVWLRRHDNDESLRKVRQEFRHARVMKSLLDRDRELHGDLSRLYERTIDFGAHPNERALSSSATKRIDGDEVVIRNQILHKDSSALDHALVTTAQVGLGSLRVFRLIFRERFDLLGLGDTIEELGRVL